MILMTPKKEKMPEEVQKVTKSETRRGSKPLVEKKRRARINNSLAELQNLVVMKTKKQGYKQSRIEKADILEMTVRHLQEMQKQEKKEHLSSASVNDRFKEGYLECMSQVARFFTSVEKTGGILHDRLKNHLVKCMDCGHSEAEEDSSYPETDFTISFTVSDTTPSPSPPPCPSQMTTTTNFPAQEPLAGIRVFTSRLSSGDLAFVVPTRNYVLCDVCDASVSRHCCPCQGGPCTSAMASYDTPSSSSGYLSRVEKGGNPNILRPSGGQNVQGSVPGDVWRPW